MVPILIYFSASIEPVSSAAGLTILGFVINQAYRILFERFWGFSSAKRNVLRKISKRCLRVSETKPRFLSRRRLDTAFVIWETTFYDCDFPESVRKHNESLWHYVVSFQTNVLASLIGVLLLLVLHYFYVPKIMAAHEVSNCFFANSYHSFGYHETSQYMVSICDRFKYLKSEILNVWIPVTPFCLLAFLYILAIITFIFKYRLTYGEIQLI